MTMLSPLTPLLSAGRAYGHLLQHISTLTPPLFPIEASPKGHRHAGMDDKPPSKDGYKPAHGFSGDVSLWRLSPNWLPDRLLGGMKRTLPPLEASHRLQLCFSEPRSPLHRGLRLLLGEQHEVYSTLGLAANVVSIALALGHYGSLKGFPALLAEYREHAQSWEHLPVQSNTFIGEARRHYLHGINLYAKAMALDVGFEGLEKIPQQGHAVVLAANHASIFPDFLLAWADPRIAPVAAVENFSHNRCARRSGAALYFDLLGLPFIQRKALPEKTPAGQRKALAGLEQRLFDLMRFHGTRPLFFAQGGRVPTAYDDEGKQSFAGFYSNTPQPDHPEVTFQPGGAFALAAKVASRLKKPVSVIVVSMRGTEQVMPKHTANTFPFFGANRIGQRISYRVVDVIEIAPGQKRLSALAARATERLKEDLGIRAQLEQVIRRWAHKEHAPPLAEHLTERAARDERCLIIADRIRSIHPQYREREFFKARLFHALRDAPGAERGDAEIRILLRDVSAYLTDDAIAEPASRTKR